MKIEIIKERPSLWQWWVKRGRSIVGGGYCRTKRDAINDAGIFASESSNRLRVQRRRP